MLCIKNTATQATIMMMETGGCVIWGNLGCWFKYTLLRGVMLVYNITMTEENLLDSHHVKMVTVYASSSAALKPVYYDAARRMGEVLASAGKSIIYGAGGGGLMGSVADGALSKNGKVYGVVPEFLQDLELTHRGLTGLRIVKEMRLRKQLMLEDSHAVVTLPGGSGTYEELFEALTMKRLGRWVGPIILVNTDGFYDGLLQFLQHSINECFMGSKHLKMWSVVDEPEQVLDAIENSHTWDSDALQFANVTHANA
jgi:uncharacterized protein (TIGR00730 family)